MSWRLVALGLAWSANTIAAPARDVSLSDALRDIVAAPEHRVLQARQAEAAADVDAAGAWPGTVLETSTTRLTPRLDIAVALPLPVFGTLSANRTVARDDFAAAVAEARASDLELARDVAVAWIALARVEAHAELSQRSATREEELARAAKDRFDAGESSHADVVLAVATAKRARAKATADDAAIDAASADLAGLLGWDPTVRLHASGGLPTPALDAIPSATVHPQQLAAAQRAEAEHARVVETERAGWPRVALDLESMIGDPTIPGTDFRIGVTMEVPLLGHTAANVHAAESRLAAARITSAAVSSHLGADLVAARTRFSSAAQHAASLERDVLPAQREAAELARAAFREGQTGLVSVLEAERGLADAEGEAADARADADAAFVDLQWASGAIR
jgi:outer membrane protein TolC